MHTIHTSTICHLTGLHVGCSIPSHHTESYSESHICAAKICLRLRRCIQGRSRDRAPRHLPLASRAMSHNSSGGEKRGEGSRGSYEWWRQGKWKKKKWRRGGEGGGLSQLLWISAVCETLVGRDETCSWNVWMSHYQSHGEALVPRCSTHNDQQAPFLQEKLWLKKVWGPI